MASATPNVDSTIDEASPSSRLHHGNLPALALGALGIVFGDIGTSPLYTLQMTTTEHAMEPTQDNVLGVLSLIFWGLTLVVAVKYLSFVMRADNRGEGGILALLALIPEKKNAKAIGWVSLMVIAGAALLYGDGVITPAISVLSAIEGLKLAAPTVFTLPIIITITVVILIGLFAIQRQGTGKIGRYFGPVMLVWFLTIGVLGAAQVIRHPFVLRALSPLHGIRYFTHHGWHGFPMLGVVVLCLTGGEALYADMGHFGARPIRFAWIFLAMPALVLCYFGQGALMLTDKETLANPFFALVPSGIPTYALVALATAATIIASQALISGVFSLTNQALTLGFFPRVTIKHTSHETEGQIYVPEMNWALALGATMLVLSFKESSKLAAAFGIAVSGTMAITSITFYLVTRRTWQWPIYKALPVLLLFLSFDLPFFGANLLKFLDGGYIPIILGAVLFIIMVVWKGGRHILSEYQRTHSAPLSEFLATVEKRIVTRIPGTSIFMASTSDRAPTMLEHLAKRIHVLSEHVVLLTVAFEHVPFVKESQRLEVTVLEKGFIRIVARYGFMQHPDVPMLLAHAKTQRALPISLEEATYFVGRETFLATARGKMGPIRESIFGFLSRNARSATSYFSIPHEQVVELGSQIDL